MTRIFAEPVTTASTFPDGSTVLRSGIPLEPYAGSMAGMFRAAAAAHPDRILVAQRAAAGWRTLSYTEARRQVDGLAQGLLDRCGPAARPVMILSGNSIEHLLLTLACYTIGVPAVPVSTAYALLASDHATLRVMSCLVRPAVVFADDGDAYAQALRAVTGPGDGAGPGYGGGARCTVITMSGRAGDARATAFGELAETPVTSRVDERAAAVGPDTVAKVLFTSGSTGHP